VGGSGAGGSGLVGGSGAGGTGLVGGSGAGGTGLVGGRVTGGRGVEGGRGAAPFRQPGTAQGQLQTSAYWVMLQSGHFRTNLRYNQL
jgi:hypothetical protein